MVPHSYVGKPSFHKRTIDIPDVDSLWTGLSKCWRLVWTKNWPSCIIRYVGVGCKFLVAVAAQTLSCDACVYLTGAREEIIAYHIL